MMVMASGFSAIVVKMRTPALRFPANTNMNAVNRAAFHYMLAIVIAIVFPIHYVKEVGNSWRTIGNRQAMSIE